MVVPAMVDVARTIFLCATDTDSQGETISTKLWQLLNTGLIQLLLTAGRSSIKGENKFHKEGNSENYCKCSVIYS